VVNWEGGVNGHKERKTMVAINMFIELLGSILEWKNTLRYSWLAGVLTQQCPKALLRCWMLGVGIAL